MAVEFEVHCRSMGNGLLVGNLECVTTIRNMYLRAYSFAGVFDVLGGCVCDFDVFVQLSRCVSSSLLLKFVLLKPMCAYF